MKNAKRLKTAVQIIWYAYLVVAALIVLMAFDSLDWHAFIYIALALPMFLLLYLAGNVLADISITNEIIAKSLGGQLEEETNNTIEFPEQ